VRSYALVEADQIKENPNEADKVGLTVWIAVTQKKFTARSNLELRMHPHHKGVYDRFNFEPGERCESFMGVPLIVGAKLIGVLKVETKMRVVEPASMEFTYFGEQDEIVFDLIANSAAIAIENAHLVDESKQRLYEELSTAYEELKELDKRKTEFLDTVSHELRTPLTPVKSCIDGLLSGLYGPLTCKQRSRLEIALASANDETRLIDNLLDLVRIQNGRAMLNLEWVGVTGLTRKVIKVFEYDASEKHIALTAVLPRDDDLETKLDEGKIKQVLSNLVDNAVKFTRPGGAITVSAQRDGRWICVQVSDTGIGIPEAEHERIFDRFYQVDASLTREVGGTGIGLNIVKEYVKMHGGKVWVESEPGKGAKFVFRLPAMER
jgi:signal transduction histidine kinase